MYHSTNNRKHITHCLCRICLSSLLMITGCADLMPMLYPREKTAEHRRPQSPPPVELFVKIKRIECIEVDCFRIRIFVNDWGKLSGGLFEYSIVYIYDTQPDNGRENAISGFIVDVQRNKYIDIEPYDIEEVLSHVQYYKTVIGYDELHIIGTKHVPTTPHRGS